MGVGYDFCNRCGGDAWVRFGRVLLLVLLGCLLFGSACAPALRTHRVRFEALKLDVIVYETEAQASRQCKKHIAKWERATGLTHRLDNGTMASPRQEYRGCHVAPLHAGLNSHILTSAESVDNLCHELCHALGAKREVCESIHFNKLPPGRTVTVPGTTEEE